MRWPWSKKPEPTPEPAPLDDWEPRIGDWTQEMRCHCGRICGGNIVCPACGHYDQWTVTVYRMEWEHSQDAMRRVHTPLGIAGLGPVWTRPEWDRPWTRNAKRVVWTPEHCPVNP